MILKSAFLKVLYPAILVFILLLPCSGTATSKENTGEPSRPSLIIRETEDKVLYRTPDNTRAWISKRPKRVVVLLTSLLNLWYETGGQAVARCSGRLHVPQAAMDLPTAGTFNNPNMEKIIALEPDLVISANLPAFRAILPILKENHIEYAYLNYTNYYDYTGILTLFSKLNKTEDRVETVKADMARRINEIQMKRIGRPAPKVLVVFSTSNSISCELANSHTGVMLSMLGAENIIPNRFQAQGKTRVYFSLERIVCLDPDIILLNTMGDVAQCRDRLEKEFSDNEAWSGLRAIREKRFHVLPKEYFLYKPNARFPEALAYLADILYEER